MIIKTSNQDLVSNNTDELNIVVYDQKSEHTNQLDFENSFTILVLKKLAQKFKSVSFLIEGFDNFERMYPNLCESSSECTGVLCLPNFDTSPSVKLLESFSKPKHLRLNHSLSSYIIDLNSSSNSALSSSTSSDNEPKFFINYLVSPSEDKQPINEPTKILDFLYLGSQDNALCQQSLEKLGITYVLNVSITCPKAEFIMDANFLRIPINDGHTAKIISYFEVAYKFIEKCRKANKKVLIHCLAGISRSPTLAISYLMKYMRIKSEEAFKFVKDKRSSISPNFNFLGQLNEYEKQLINNGLLNETVIKNGQNERLADDQCQQPNVIFSSLKKKKFIYDFEEKNFVLNKPCTARKISCLQSPSTAFSKFNLNSPIIEKQSLSKSLTCNSIAEIPSTSQTNQTGAKLANVVMRRPTNLSLFEATSNRLKRPCSIFISSNFNKKYVDSSLARTVSVDSASSSCSTCTPTKTISCCQCAQIESNIKKIKMCQQFEMSDYKSPVLLSPLSAPFSNKLNNDINIKSNELNRIFLSSENLREDSKSRDDLANDDQNLENNENSLLLLNTNKSNSSSSSSNKNSLHGSTETMIEVL